MKFISTKKTILFSKISGDKNGIHLYEKVANQYFFKSPIVHGINLIILSLIMIFHSKKIKKLQFIKINFKNYCLNNEKFYLIKRNSRYITKSKSNVKLEIELKLKGKKINNYKEKLNLKARQIIEYYKLKTKFFFLLNLFKHFFLITKKIGNIDDNKNTIIHSITTSENNNTSIKNKIINIKRITNNIFRAQLSCYGYKSNIIYSKLAKLKNNLKKFKLNKKIEKKLNFKNFLIFGASSDIAKATIFFLKKKNNKIIKISLKKKINVIKLKNLIKKTNPEYIFYFSSPNIVNNVNNNSIFYKNYDEVYFKKFKVILDILSRNKLTSKVFYPSTFALGQRKNFLRLKSYLNAKAKGEKLCKNHKYSKYIYCYRLPAFKSRTNYNMLGYYEGEDLYKIKNYLNVFLKN
jgi:hypothetical protein